MMKFMWKEDLKYRNQNLEVKAILTEELHISVTLTTKLIKNCAMSYSFNCFSIN